MQVKFTGESKSSETIYGASSQVPSSVISTVLLKHFYLIQVQLIYNVFISAVEQSNSVIHIYVFVCIYACMLSHFSHVQLFATPWFVVRQAPLAMVFSRQEYWSGLPCLPSGDLPNLGIKPRSLPSPALAAAAVHLLSRVQLFATPWTVARQAPPFKEFSSQEYQSGLPFPSPVQSQDNEFHQS